MRGGPIVREIFNKLETEIGRARMERHPTTGTIGLELSGIAVWQRDGSEITVPAYTAQCSEVMIKRAILLHHDDDMFDIGDRARAVVCWKRQGSANACWECGGQRGCAEELKKGTAISTHCGIILVFRFLRFCDKTVLETAADKGIDSNAERMRSLFGQRLMSLFHGDLWMKHVTNQRHQW